MKKRLFYAIILIVVALLAFWAGKNVSKSSCTTSNNEIHFIDPKYITGSEFSFQTLMANVVQDSLKRLKPPFTSEKLNALISSIEEKQRLKNYIKLVMLPH